jgi:hypothetical protein
VLPQEKFSDNKLRGSGYFGVQSISSPPVGN